MFMLFRLHDLRWVCATEMTNSLVLAHPSLTRLSDSQTLDSSLYWSSRCKLHVRSLVKLRPVDVVMSMIIKAYVCHQICQNVKIPSQHSLLLSSPSSHLMPSRVIQNPPPPTIMPASHPCLISEPSPPALPMKHAIILLLQSLLAEIPTHNHCTVAYAQHMHVQDNLDPCLASFN